LASEDAPRSENGGSGHDPIAPVRDKAAQALAFLLKKPPNCDITCRMAEETVEEKIARYEFVLDA
jgi:hypothetical protein